MAGFGAAESSVDRMVLCALIIIVTFVFIALWLSITVPHFGGARIAGAIASTGEPAVFYRAKAGQSGKGCHGFRSFLAEVVLE